MKLITEEIEKVEVITEGTGKERKLYITGTFLQAECVNRNGRMYPMPIMEREVRRYTEQYINKGRALGELGHPDGPTVNLDRVSHMIVSLHREGNNFAGKAQILPTPMGKIAESLLNSGVCLGVSSRGIGSLRENLRGGYKEVGEDFMLATAADIVADPSAPDAFVQGIMEGVEWIYDASRNDWLIEKTKKKINRLVETKEYQEKKLELFDEFLNSL
jgi:hypothetical protein